MELRVVLVIVGILTVQFCLFYNEHNTNKGEDNVKILFNHFFNVFFINVSERVFTRNVLNTGPPLYQEDSMKKVLFFTPFFQDEEWRILGLHPERLAKVNK